MCLFISTHSLVPGQAVIQMTENVGYRRGGDGIASASNPAYGKSEDYHLYEELPEGSHPVEEKKNVGGGTDQSGEYYVNDDLLPGDVAAGGGKDKTQEAKKKQDDEYYVNDNLFPKDVATDGSKEVKDDEYYVNDDLFPADGDKEQHENAEITKEEELADKEGKKEEGEEVGKEEAKEEACEGETVDGYLVMEGQFPMSKEDTEGAD